MEIREHPPRLAAWNDDEDHMHHMNDVSDQRTHAPYYCVELQ